MKSNNMEATRYQAGERIFKEGDVPKGVYLIHKGKVQITKNKNGEDVILAERGWNEIFGEMALIDRTNSRSATVTAVEDTWCYVLSDDDFREKVKQLDPFMRGIFEVLVKSVRETTDKYFYS